MKDDSAVQITNCHSKEPGFGSQHPRGSSELQVRRNRAPPSGLCGQQVNMQCNYIYAGKTLIHIKILSDLKNKLEG